MNTDIQQMIELIDSNDSRTSEELIRSSIDQEHQNISAGFTLKTFRSPILPLKPSHTSKTRRTRHSKSSITTHHIGAWTIQESLKPFLQKEEPLISIKPNVLQWTIDDVCLFVKQILSTDTYTPIIQEQLIDGFALLLLKEEHLNNIFHMDKKSRMKLLNKIQQYNTEFI